VRLCSWITMLTAIHFDCQITFITEKVQYIGSNWILAPELTARHVAISEMMPKQFFGPAHFTAEGFGLY